jgi:hypothetical protein
MNGFANGGTTSPADGNGNGFKMGSSATGIRHIVQRNVAWKNKASGFYANHSTGGNNWYNNTSFMNGTQYNMLASPAGDPNTTITLTGALAHKMRNNIGFPNKNANMTGVDTSFNTWDLNIAQAATDFMSTTLDTTYQGARQADGSMPNIPFLKLASGSPLIDKGTDVGLPFAGSAPDLGAYEFGLAGAGGTGAGGSGAGGAAGGTGGRSGTGGNGAGGAQGGAGSSGTAGATGSGGTGDGSGGSGAGAGGSTITGAGGAISGAGGSTGPGEGPGGASGGCNCALATSGGPLELGGLTSFLILAGVIAASRRARRRR